MRSFIIIALFVALLFLTAGLLGGQGVNRCVEAGNNLDVCINTMRP